MWTSKPEIPARDRDQFESHSELPGKTLVIPTRNFILGSLSHADVSQLVSASRAVHVEPGDEIYNTGEQIERLFFPVDCVVSSVALLEDGTTVEISMTGPEGIVGLAAIVGGGRSLHWTRASTSGALLRIPKASLEEAFTKHPDVQRAVLGAYRSLFTQVCQRSVCNTRHTLLQRLAVWLLMMQDRLNDESMPFTQEEIASRISVRRAGVSVAASMLQAMHGISYHRGKIVIVDRSVLETTACECYEILGYEFRSDSPGGGRATAAPSAAELMRLRLRRQ